MIDLLYEEFKINEITLEKLRNFDRYQKVEQCWRKENGNWMLKDIAFIEQWGEAELKSIVEELENTLKTGGSVFAAEEKQCIKGFVSVEKQLFGPSNEYVQLYVSADMRKCGIGKKLFELAAAEAKTFRAEPCDCQMEYVI